MKELALPSYQELGQVLSKTSLKLHPSQAHGLVCGILSGNTVAAPAWEELVTGGEKTAKTQRVLQMLYEASAKQLSEFSFEFQLILPAEAEALSLKAEALTLWCQGFLTGLKIAQVPLIGREPGEVTETINDMIEIAKMSYEDTVASEENEMAYIELMEYIRMAVVLIYQDLHEEKMAKRSSPPSDHLH